MADDLLPETFTPCGPIPQTAIERLDGTEIAGIAKSLGIVVIQTVRLFIWMSSLTKQSEVDGLAIQAFADRLAQVGHRWGTAEKDFEVSVQTAIAESAHRRSRPRSPATVARHRARMRKVADYDVPRLEKRFFDRIMIRLSPIEIASVEGYDDAVVLVLVERMGKVVGGRQILSLEQFSADRAKPLSEKLPTAAAAVLASLSERGRAFVVTRHSGDCLRVIENFWVATP